MGLVLGPKDAQRVATATTTPPATTAGMMSARSIPARAPYDTLTRSEALSKLYFLRYFPVSRGTDAIIPAQLARAVRDIITGHARVMHATCIYIRWYLGVLACHEDK